ncbi:hypothetical protein MAR_001063 [Mya arenaria]|uniref:Uncharacterized protein n=1 Tax=Mya arenaria TaxID=6604 RepID=A0ABY7FAT7_MYAAR|nr:hypothetical protein MAR_001063 [Mya arenaria]
MGVFTKVVFFLVVLQVADYAHSCESLSNPVEEGCAGNQCACDTDLCNHGNRVTMAMSLATTVFLFVAMKVLA